MNNKLQDPSKLHIKSIDTKPKENVGSLLNLFSSPYFTLDMAIIYLYRKRNETGVHDFLVNKLYNYSDQEISFYIPQLCYSLIRTHSQALERFLLDKCVKNITLFLKILWCIKSYGQSERRNKKSYDYVETLTQKAEMAMVNGTVANKLTLDPFGMPTKPHGELTPQELDEMVAEAERKRNRVEYLSETLRLINILVSISVKLKEQKIEDRKGILKSYVIRINKWLTHMRKKHSGDRDENFRKLFYGIHLPFFANSEDKSTQVVRIIEDELTCFNTKKRAPYRIVVETIDMNELESLKGHRTSETKSDNSDSHFIHSLEEDNWDDLISDQMIQESASPTLPTTQTISMGDKYAALVDFGKIAKQEEAKWKDEKILKGVDLVQKYEVLRNKGGSMILNEQPVGDLGGFRNRKPTIDMKEETKSAELQKEMHFRNVKKFGEFFPKNKIERRQSFSESLDSEARRTRSSSADSLSTDETVSTMERFKEKYVPEKLIETHIRVIEKIQKRKSEYPSLPSPIPFETSHSMPVKEEDLKGWGPWGVLWEYKKKAIKEKSPFGHLKSYKLRCMVVKANDDLRQELLVMQIMNKIKSIWEKAGLSLALSSYDILVTSNDSGLLEFVIDTMSIDGIKKNNPGKSLLQFFIDTFEYDFEEARKNFMDSLAAYSIICYLLQIKDRHNGNILLNALGHIVHIDFGFILSTSPGGINFESAPFKLTSEYVELMEGYGSATFVYFKMQMIRGFMELRGHVDSLVYMLEIMMENSDLPCFEVFDINVFRERFKQSATDNEMMEYVSKLIDSSFDNWRTVQYDNFQKYSNGILP